MKEMKFQAGTFLEIENLTGGRKVVQVCKDGITYWDSLSAPVAPVLIHPVLKPVSLGTLPQFVKSFQLETLVNKLITYCRLKSETRLDNDALFLMRAVWLLAQKNRDNSAAPELTDLQWACEQAERQEQEALELHENAKKYTEMVP